MSSPRWPELTAVFGGTFDPPHLGHVEAVQGLFENPGFNRVWIVPSGRPNLKNTLTPSHHRLEMTRLAFQDTTRKSPVEILDLELSRAERNPELPTYSFETLSELRRSQPNLAFVIGSDQLASLHHWHRFPEILSLCHWLVLTRKHNGNDQAIQALEQLRERGLVRSEPTQSGAWRLPETTLQIVPTPARALSSSEIRLSFERTGKGPENSLSPAVEDYLMRHRLYGTQSVKK